MNNTTNNNSSAKTVTGENSENINEQASTAQVINPLNNEKTTMEKTDTQSSMAPQVGANETALGNAEGTAVNANESATETQVLTSIKLPTPEAIRHFYSYRELLKAGYKIAFVKGNRNINVAHAKKLAKSAANSSQKTFLQAGKIVHAVDALNAGVELVDADGKQLTSGTENIEYYIVLIDGQHREFATRLDGSIDLLIEFMDLQGEDIHKCIVMINNDKKGWIGDDYINAIRKMHSGKVPLLDELDRLCKEYGVSRKFLLALLCNNKDYIRLSKLIQTVTEASPDLSGYNIKDSMIEFGEQVLIAFQERFKLCLKTVSTATFIEALMNIEACLSEADQTKFKELLAVFVHNLSDEEVKNIKEHVSAKDFSSLKNYLTSRYNTFIQSNATNLDSIKNETCEALKEMANAKASVAIPVRRLKSGTTAELLQNEQELKEQKEQRAQERKKAREAEKERKKREREECKATIKDEPIESPQ